MRHDAQGARAGGRRVGGMVVTARNERHQQKHGEDDAADPHDEPPVMHRAGYTAEPPGTQRPPSHASYAATSPAARRSTSHATSVRCRMFRVRPRPPRAGLRPVFSPNVASRLGILLASWKIACISAGAFWYWHDTGPAR